MLGLLSLLLTSSSALSLDLADFAASPDPGYLRLDPGRSGGETRFSLSDQTSENSLYKLGAKFNAIDEAQPKSGALQGLSLPRKNWEQNNVEDLRLNFSTFGDWLQLSVREAQSQYSADQNYLRMLASRNNNKNSPGKERFLGLNGVEGTAALQRLDAKLFSSDLIGVSTFAFRSAVDPNYESLASTKAKDEFATSNRVSDAGGAKIRLASVSITTSYTNSNRMVGIATPTESRQDQTIALDLVDLRNRIGDPLPVMFWAVAPSGIYAGTFVKETSYKTIAEGPPDRTTGITAGAYWTWDYGNANLSYWNYALDSRRVGVASYDSAGRGLDASVGFYKGPVAFYAGLSYRHMDDLSPVSLAFDRTYDVYLSLTYRPAYLPDVIVDGGLGRYAYDSRIYGIASNTNYWTATLALEFAKFLWNAPVSKATPKSPAKSPSLKLFYRYYNEADYGIVGATPGDSHLFGLMFRTTLQ
jgi:hypothetical protein